MLKRAANKQMIVSKLQARNQPFTKSSYEDFTLVGRKTVQSKATESKEDSSIQLTQEAE